MTTPTGVPAEGALAALQRLETALEQRDDSQDAMQARLASAHADAERILAAARAAGADAGRRRRAARLAQAQTEATAIRAAADLEAERLTTRMSAERAQLVAALTGLVLGEEVHSHARADDARPDSRTPNGSGAAATSSPATGAGAAR